MEYNVESVDYKGFGLSPGGDSIGPMEVTFTFCEGAEGCILAINDNEAQMVLSRDQMVDLYNKLITYFQ